MFGKLGEMLGGGDMDKIKEQVMGMMGSEGDAENNKDKIQAALTGLVPMLTAAGKGDKAKELAEKLPDPVKNFGPIKSILESL
uniref:Uncharacterized protein n=1 Tax=Chromera velia CCMP2878 TaxID=1169474 RepID=A0A0G4F9A4_9ALVE|mmetsp:Transcript_53370/g.104388  ORF Transcript_53370/g.104388 Transcript_53370/m.104388 type:complete len:83 (-) Transcript_53370:669-917(-)|eukprot:Cvel_15861.t1-p1 / transcript=Cvel_15861.t1 / gene=Cvel_15861 / organism=Chromera_velia_CCMP2878 / gene_product=hypothetical protein / transcript_product=hypothetical protein / location=Cvel_scaffold1195:51012-52525(+) / protein_length=82 / sequence_SO=supercontig / SO=protein_coding / is_pseudo=false